MSELDNAVLNDVLCFLSTARSTLSHDKIIESAIGFYGVKPIREAKKTICRISETRYVARKQCDSHRNPATADIDDILKCFEKIANDNITAPKFVCSGYSALPPMGFENLAAILCALRLKR